MLYIFVMSIFVIAAAVFLAFAFARNRSIAQNEYSRESPVPVKRLTLGAVVAGAVLTLLFSITTVDHREVAIVTSMGKYNETIATGGPHLIAPWASTTKFDQTLQPVDLVDISVSFTDGSDDPELQEIGGGKGLIDAQVHWQISKDQDNDGAKALWQSYRTFDKVSVNLVNRAARDAVIDAANSYPAATAIINQGDIARDVEESLTERLAPYGIIVDSVSIPAIDLDPSTQAAVDKIFTTQQDIKRAENEQIRAKIDAETVALREAEGALSPAANQRYCLDLVNNWDVAKNGPLPATFNCVLSGATQPDVIVNGNTPVTP